MNDEDTWDDWMTWLSACVTYVREPEMWPRRLRRLFIMALPIGLPLYLLVNLAMAFVFNLLMIVESLIFAELLSDETWNADGIEFSDLY